LLVRDKDGRFNAEDCRGRRRRGQGSTAAGKAPGCRIDAAKRRAPPAGRAGLAGGGEARGPRRLGRAGGRPHPVAGHRFQRRAAHLKVDGLSTAKGSKAKLDLQAGINKRGQFGVKGTLGLAPLAGNLDLDLKAVDITMLQPYVTEKVKIAITRGKLTSRGRLAFELPAGGGPGQLQGQRDPGRFRVGGQAQRHRLPQVEVALFWRGGCAAGAAGGEHRRHCADRLLHPPDPRRPGRPQPPRDHRPARQRGQGRGCRRQRHGTARGTAGTDGKAAATVAPAEPPPPVRIKRITLQGGNIAYSDRFIKPNYDANLTGMGGRLTGLSSDPNTIAELDLRGKVDNSAPLEIVGRLNPFRQDRALDIRASVKDFELSSVSTYAAKYVGYGIEKGKLSAQLGYKIEDRKLTATNQVFLDQLTFGDKVDSPSALKLPVLLAVSLLKNSRGEIDLDLPVGGSLDDPQFSVGGIVVKVIVNLITKAITSPFALLGSIFGGNAEELAWLDFEPGFARLGPGPTTSSSRSPR
jgi:hypothetical protein